MACQTGIRGDEKLFDFFEQCKKCTIRFGKIVINNEKLTINSQYKPSKNWRHDWKKCLPEKVDSYEPCFLMFRFDSSHDWILITFADDKASTKDKMLLAATKATFKSEFGQNFIRAEFHVTNRNDLILDAFEKHYLASNNIKILSDPDDESQPLSFVERELATVNKDYTSGNPFVIHSPQAPKGVQFPIDHDAMEKIREFASGIIDFVQCSIDTLNEAIKLERHQNSVESSDLKELIPRGKPRYSLYRLRDNGNSYVFFIYSIPPTQACTIKELMLCSSCKSPFINEIQSELGISINKKMEVDSRDSLDNAFFLSYLDTRDATPSPRLVKPKRPGRGPMGLTNMK